MACVHASEPNNDLEDTINKNLSAYELNMLLSPSDFQQLCDTVYYTLNIVHIIINHGGTKRREILSLSILAKPK